MRNIMKRMTALFLSVAMIVSPFGGITLVNAQETVNKAQEEFGYAMYATSYEEGAITLEASNVCINGNIMTKGTVEIDGNINFNGKKVENVDKEMMFFADKIADTYFKEGNYTSYTENYRFENMNINLNNSISVKGSCKLMGNVNLNASIRALNDINIGSGVLNSNNSVLYAQKGDITIDSNNVSITGLVYAPYGTVNITAQNINLNSTIIIAEKIVLNAGNINANYNSNMGKFVMTEEKPEASLYAFGVYVEETDSIDIEWYSDYEKGEYEILTSNDDKEYYSTAVITDSKTYQYSITEDFDVKYFKVEMLTDYGKVVESVPIKMVSSESGYTTELIDTDRDKIADILEGIHGTDKNKMDTDEDGLTDYEELIITSTDPIKYDSVFEGVSDAEADSDNDSIINQQEIILGTNPTVSDTDEDGLSDGEEVSIYKTNPLVQDTDGDTLIDGDEPFIELDPVNPKTYGVPDAEYVTEQNIFYDSEVFADINTEDSPYKMSIDVKASGYVEGGLEVEETGYMSVMENDAMLGIGTEISYSNIENIEEITLKFKISEEYLENTLGLFPEVEELSGIKRINVFKYFEEVNMLLPLETEYDEENNIVLADVDSFGTYCIMDMELWLDSFEVPEEIYQPQPALMSLSVEDDEPEFCTEDTIMTYTGDIEEIENNSNVDNEELSCEIMQSVLLMSSSNDYNVTPIDVAFVLQTSGQLKSTFEEQKDMIGTVMSMLVSEYGSGNVRVCIVTYSTSGADVLETLESDMWFTDVDELYEALDCLTYTYTSGYTDRGNAFRMLQNKVIFRESASKFIFQVMNGSTDVGSLYFDQINTCERLEINYSELMPVGYQYVSSSYGAQVQAAIRSTNGISLTYGSESYNDVYNHICSYSVAAETEFAARLPMGWRKIVLDGVLDSKNGVNSDTDDLTDWQEVNTDLIKWNTDGSLELLTVKECMDIVSNSSNSILGASKILNLYNRYDMSDRFTTYMDYIMDCKILPVHSDPTDEDTDNDGLLDGTEIYEHKTKIAPKDPDPLHRTGISGIWEEQIYQEKNGVIATDYASDGVGMELGLYQFVADGLVELALSMRDDINKYEDELRSVLLTAKKVMEGDTVLGAYFLNFIYDDEYVAYHSQVDTWQREFGYNDLYDDAFKIGSYMHYGKVAFDAADTDEEYTLWMWKGDYWNLQSGAEIGLYVYDETINDTEHYDVVEFELPMTLSLYNYYSSDDIDNVFNWKPEDAQWWITGFNPEFKDANPEYMVTMGKIDFIGHEELFDGIKNGDEKRWINIKKDNLIFDEDGHTLWIMWDYGV